LSVNLPHSGYSTYFSYPQTRKPAKKKNLGLRAAEDLHAMHLPDASLSHVSPYYNPFHQRDYLAASRSPSSFIPSSIPTLVDLSRDSNLRFPAMESLSREELERFQKLSNEYEPDVQVSRKDLLENKS
jgi:hypothetical protein